MTLVCSYIKAFVDICNVIPNCKRHVEGLYDAGVFVY